MNYQEATEKIKNRESKKLANNTYLHKIAGGLALKLHQTDIIEFYPEYVVLNTGGWFTHTTKERLNAYSPVFIHQKNSNWYIGGYEDSTSLYYDGIKIDYTGRILSGIKAPEKTEKANRSVKRQIVKFADACIKKVKSGNCIPSSGDCWFCALRTDDGETLGDKERSADHLRGHIKENYTVPSLIWNAIKEAGYQYPEVILGYDPETKKTGSGWFVEDSIKRAVVKYLQRRLLVRV
jgi:hypothetical protein